jgi:hypothetical protein
VAVVAVLAVQRRQAVLELQARSALMAVLAARAERHRVELEELVAYTMVVLAERVAPVARAAPVLSGMQLTAPVAVAVEVVIVVVPVH